MKRILIGAVAFSLLMPIPASAVKTYTLSLTLEVVQKYPGVSAPENVVDGCREGFPIDETFTKNGRWEILGSKGEIVATGGIGKITAKNIKKVAPPFSDENTQEYQPYIYNGTCVYNSKIKVPKVNGYRFNFAGVDLETSYSFAELAKKKWKLTIKTDLNCDGLYGKTCSFTSK